MVHLSVRRVRAEVCACCAGSSLAGRQSIFQNGGGVAMRRRRTWNARLFGRSRRIKITVSGWVAHASTSARCPSQRAMSRSKAATSIPPTCAWRRASRRKISLSTSKRQGRPDRLKYCATSGISRYGSAEQTGNRPVGSGRRVDDCCGCPDASPGSASRCAPSAARPRPESVPASFHKRNR